MRPLEFHDGAIPSGNSVAMLNLLRLGSITGRPDYEDRAQRIGRAFGAQAHRMPEAFCMLMCALEFETGPRPTIVIAGARNAPGHERIAAGCEHTLSAGHLCAASRAGPGLRGTGRAHAGQ